MRVRILLAAFLIAACDDATRPVPAVPTYALHQWGEAGQPLPAPFRTIILADTLRFPDTGGVVSHSYVLVTNQGVVRRTVTHQRRDPLVIDFHCHETNDACPDIYAPTSASVRADSLIFPANSWNARRVYVRVR